MTEVVHIIVKGRVQGVGFRYFTEDLAHRLGVAGWVRNLPGGQVEVLARVGPANKGRFLAGLQKGPSMARVDALDVATSSHPEDCPERGFSVRF